MGIPPFDPWKEAVTPGRYLAPIPENVRTRTDTEDLGFYLWASDVDQQNKFMGFWCRPKWGYHHSILERRPLPSTHLGERKNTHRYWRSRLLFMGSWCRPTKQILKEKKKSTRKCCLSILTCTLQTCRSESRPSQLKPPLAGLVLKIEIVLKNDEAVERKSKESWRFLVIHWKWREGEAYSVLRYRGTSQKMRTHKFF